MDPKTKTDETPKRPALVGLDRKWVESYGSGTFQEALCELSLQARRAGQAHPAMGGWLAVPILCQNGGFVVVLQASDEFTHVAKMTAPTFELQYADQQLERSIQELEEQNTELEQFACTISHDLKSPLVTIQGFLGSLKQSAVEGNIEKLDADVARITGVASRMKQLLNELLELSRIGRIVNPPEDVSLGAVARAVVDLCSGNRRAGYSGRNRRRLAGCPRGWGAPAGRNLRLPSSEFWLRSSIKTM